MVGQIQITTQVAKVLRELAVDVDAHHYGMELIKSTGLKSGTLYPILERLLRAGWLIAEKEQIDPAVEGRPARRYYRLDPKHAERARYEVAHLAAQLSLDASPTRDLGGRLRPAPGGGAL